MAINNNRKPVFKDCSRYAPVVKEEADADTEVLRVEAFDADRDDIIVYAFIVTPGERQKFNINNVTGVITTRQVRPLLLSFIYLVSDELKSFHLEKLIAWFLSLKIMRWFLTLQNFSINKIFERYWISTSD